jgi:hypothetical protein
MKDNHEKDSGNGVPLEHKLHLILLGLLSFSFLGFFALRHLWIGLVFAHTAALGIMGFYGCLAGAIAKHKGYRYWRAFQIAFLLPIILGAISAFIFVPEGRLPLTCGGWVSLGAGILILVIYALIKKKK